MRSHALSWGFVPALWAALAPADVRAEKIHEGTITSLAQAGMVVKTKTGDSQVAFAPTMRITVRTMVKLDALPATVPCLVNATLKLNGTQLAGWTDPRLTLYPAGMGPAANASHVMIQDTGGAYMQNIPGVLQKGSPPTFVVAPQIEYLGMQNGSVGTLAGVDLFQGRPLPLAGLTEIECNFGPNLSMAGANAKVLVTGDRNQPNNWRVDIERTEPLPTGAVQGGKK